MFGMLKQSFQFAKALKNSVKQAKMNRMRYLEMSSSELATLPDDELTNAVFDRADNIAGSFSDMSAGIAALNEARKVVYSVWLFEMETENGGLKQFFENSSRFVTPFLSASLSSVKADAHRTLFDAFLERYPIFRQDPPAADLTNGIDSAVFDAFDKALFDLPPLSELLLPYIKKHLSDL